MAGIANDILSACAMPAQNAAIWDHTYVTAQSRLSWGCFGRDFGGSVVTSGAGSSIAADCLSYRRHPQAPEKGSYSVYAGIIYALSGVCHQASNRILFPTGRKLPPSVNGYALSYAVWGDYGTGSWVEF